MRIRAVRMDECGDDADADESGLPSTTGLPVVRLDAGRVLLVDDEPDARWLSKTDRDKTRRAFRLFMT